MLGKKPNTAILATARLMARITWQLLIRDVTTRTFPWTKGSDAASQRELLPGRPAKERENFQKPKKPLSSQQTFPSRSKSRLVGR
jgi:hypothetical protein